MRHRRIARLLACVLAVAAVGGLAVGSAVAQPAAGGVSIRLVDAPADRQNDPRARIYIVDHIKPGDRIERHIEIGNTTASTTDVELYAASASVKSGEFIFGEGRARNELTSWTTVTPGKVTVPSGGTMRATVTIQVPAKATDGERYGVIWAELPSSGGSAAVVNRVGVRMYLSVGTGKEPTSDFRIETLTAAREKDGRPVVKTTITNTGGRALDIGGQLKLEHGPGSLTAGPFNVEVGTTLGIGERAPATIHLDKGLPNGPWSATVTIRSGELVKVAKATITFPKSSGASAKPVPAESVKKQRRVLIPLAVLLALLVLVALALYAVRQRRSATPPS
jgi:hypothetical protein